MSCAKKSALTLILPSCHNTSVFKILNLNFESYNSIQNIGIHYILKGNYIFFSIKSKFKAKDSRQLLRIKFNICTNVIFSNVLLLKNNTRVIQEILFHSQHSKTIKIHIKYETKYWGKQEKYLNSLM